MKEKVKGKIREDKEEEAKRDRDERRETEMIREETRNKCVENCLKSGKSARRICSTCFETIPSDEFSIRKFRILPVF